MKKIATTAILLLAVLAAGCHRDTAPRIDYREIVFQQNELIIAYEEKVEELATVITTAFPAYKSDYSDIDSLNCILDSLYTAQ